MNTIVVKQIGNVRVERDVIDGGSYQEWRDTYSLVSNPFLEVVVRTYKGSRNAQDRHVEVVADSLLLSAKAVAELQTLLREIEVQLKKIEEVGIDTYIESLVANSFYI